MTSVDKPGVRTVETEVGEVERFVRRFGEVWAAPTPEGLNTLVHPDVTLVQPFEPDTRGHVEAARLWGRLFALVPDLRGEIVSWASRGEVVFIELRLFGTLGGRPVEWITVDRIDLDAGKVRRRVANFDPLPLIGALVLRPRTLVRYLANRIRH